MGRHNIWTKAENDIIKQHYPLLGCKLNIPGRGRLGIRTQAYKLGVKYIPSIQRDTKCCTRCRKEQSASAFRKRQRQGTRYLNATCRACDAIMQRIRPTEKKLDVTRRWRQRNPEHARALGRKYAERRKKARKREWKSWYARNRKRVIASKKAKRLADPEAYNAYIRARYAKDPGPFKVEYHKRRALLKGCEATLTREQWKSIIEQYDHCCAYCGEKLHRFTQDHVVPLSRGGGHTADNVVPACRRCNSSKNSKTPEEWIGGKS